jgi:uncharacterized protein with HEPN domain
MSPEERDRTYVAHMLECIQRINEYCGGDQNAFYSSRLLQDAVIRNLQTMAESGQRLSESTKALGPEIPWRAISGFRNVIVHNYLGLDLDAIWLVVATDLPALKIELEKLSQKFRGSSA